MISFKFEKKNRNNSTWNGNIYVCEKQTEEILNSILTDKTVEEQMDLYLKLSLVTLGMQNIAKHGVFGERFGRNFG